MPNPEQLGYIYLKMAKPAIPVEKPQRREIPEIPDPMPERLVPPVPSKPVKKSQEPVPAR